MTFKLITVGIVWVNSHSFEVKIVHRLFFFFFIPYFVWNVLKIFENYSQPARPIGELNQLVQQVMLGSPGFRNAMDCFSLCSLLWARN